MARGGFNNALAGGSIDDFLRQLRGQAGRAPGSAPDGTPHPPGYPTPGGGGPRFPGDIGDGRRPGKSGPFIPGGIPDQRGRPDGERIERSPYGRSGPFIPPLRVGDPGPVGHGRPDTPSTGGVMPAPQASQAQGRGGSGNPVNVMPYKDAPPPPAPEPQAPPDPEPEKKDPPPGSDDAFNAIPENPTARPPGNPQNRQQNQNQPPPAGNQQQPPPTGQQDPPVVVEQDPPSGATSNWENFYNTNPDMQWMRDKGMDALAAAQWNAANSTNATVKAEAQKFLDSMGGGGQGQPPPGGQQEPPPTAQDQPNPAVPGWESFFQTNPHMQWMRDTPGMTAEKAALWNAQNSTDPGIRAEAQKYLDAIAGFQAPQTGAEDSYQQKIHQVRASLPRWILDRMSAEDALNFATKNPDSKIAGMLREAGVIQ